MRLLPDEDINDPQTPLDRIVQARLKTMGHLGRSETDATDILDAQKSWKSVQRRLQLQPRVVADTAAQTLNAHEKRRTAARGVAGLPSKIKATIYTAASAATLLVLGVMYFSMTDSSGAVTGAVASANGQSQIVYATRNGQQVDITLFDGSQVTLGVASQLNVSEGFGQKNRDIDLVGQAVFSVVSQTRVPFVVNSGSTSLRVLGTRFFVRNYQTDTSVTISIHEGKVSVGSTVLTANQAMAVARDGSYSVWHADADQYDLTSGRLVLNSMPFSQAVEEINRWYDVDIHISDSSLADRYVKGTFADATPQQLAELFEVAFDVSVTIENRMLTIYPKR